MTNHHKEATMSNIDENVEEGVMLLKENNIKKYADVFTADEVNVGRALRLHHRTYDINPDMRLYASYLESNSIQMGGSIFIPTEFIDSVDPKANAIWLSVDLGTVKRETWDRTPDFIAHRTNTIEELDEAS